MTQQSKKLMVYVIREGTMFLAAEELDRKNGQIVVKDIAIIGRPANDIGFTFTTLKWVDTPTLHESALLLSEEMLPEMRPYFLAYQQKRDEERAQPYSTISRS